MQSDRLIDQGAQRPPVELRGQRTIPSMIDMAHCLPVTRALLYLNSQEFELTQADEIATPRLAVQAQMRHVGRRFRAI